MIFILIIHNKVQNRVDIESICLDELAGEVGEYFGLLECLQHFRHFLILRLYSDVHILHIGQGCHSL